MMKKVFYHPIAKFLALVLFACSSVGFLFFLIEEAAFLDSDIPSLMRYFFSWYFYEPAVFGWLIVSAIAMLLLIIFLFCVAGRSPRDDQVHLTILNKIPFDLYLIGVFFFISVLFAMTNEFAGVRSEKQLYSYLLYVIMIFIPICALTFAMTLMSFSARFHAGTWWRNNLITYAAMLVRRIWLWCWKWIKRICRKIIDFAMEIPTVPLTLIFIGSVFLLCFYSIAVTSVFLLFLTAMYAVVGILLGAIFTHRLEKGAEKLASGDLESHVDTSNMFGTYRKHAEYLNHIQMGMSEAVETQIRSERMKTELITNVSHDIKTPLTSIINYVDLMKKEPIENETLKEYLEIMERQSTRLKKLIEDLIEASKASTGNIAVEMVPTDVGVLLEQSLGEYRERLTASNLTLCVNNTVPGVQIMADGKLLWRVFDNLLGNICKYSMPGTRVYLNTSMHDQELEISFRNISFYSLNVTSEELMERFVRGDSSRHTEGSGLGLSIAKNLVELQKGKLELVIDGDLFKAVVRFPVK